MATSIRSSAPNIRNCAPADQAVALGALTYIRHGAQDRARGLDPALYLERLHIETDSQR
jgi:hypothetical protein